MLTLYDYYLSTASYRVRIALNIKNISYDRIAIHLLKDGGQQHSTEYRSINPIEFVPALVSGEHSLIESLAILEFLEEQYPEPAILPEDSFDRAYVRAIANIIACDMHPLNNLRVLQYITGTLEHDETTKLQWYHHWLAKGFQGIEALLEKEGNKGKCCYQDQLSMADICLIPQISNAVRFHFPLDDYPLVQSINDYCLSLEPFQAARVGPDE